MMQLLHKDCGGTGGAEWAEDKQNRMRSRREEK